MTALVFILAAAVILLMVALVWLDRRVHDLEDDRDAREVAALNERLWGERR